MNELVYTTQLIARSFGLPATVEDANVLSALTEAARSFESATSGQFFTPRKKTFTWRGDGNLTQNFPGRATLLRLISLTVDDAAIDLAQSSFLEEAIFLQGRTWLQFQQTSEPSFLRRTNPYIFSKPRTNAKIVATGYFGWLDDISDFTTTTSDTSEASSSLIRVDDPSGISDKDVLILQVNDKDYILQVDRLEADTEDTFRIYPPLPVAVSAGCPVIRFGKTPALVQRAVAIIAGLDSKASPANGKPALGALTSESIGNVSSTFATAARIGLYGKTGDARVDAIVSRYSRSSLFTAI